MQEFVTKIVDACVEAHITANTTRDAKKAFTALISHTYNEGLKDGEEKARKEVESRQVRPAASQAGQGQVTDKAPVPAQAPKPAAATQPTKAAVVAPS